MNKRNLFIIGILLAIIGYFFFVRKPAPKNEVIIYVAHDQDYAQPILEQFEAATAITVKAVYDTEASKTVGLVNRLIAEKDNPQADVFWNNEVSRTIQLKKEGVLDAFKPSRFDHVAETHKDIEGYWTGFAARARVLIVNTDLVSEQSQPQTLTALTSRTIAAHTVIADPRFGTTGSHLAALYTIWGEEKTFDYLRTMKQNGMQVLQSNGAARDAVVDGTAWIGFTDTDDANDAISAGEPIVMIYPDQGEDEIGTLVIPNTVMLIYGARNPENARTLLNYLVSPEVESQLAHAKSAQMPLLPDVDRPERVPDVSTIKAMNVNWEMVYENLDPVLTFVEEELL